MYADFSVFTAMVLISALIHETGHIVFLKAFGCEIRSITLMPFGAVIDSDEKILSYKREAAVALAGAVFNICAGLSALLFFAAVKDIYSLFFAITNFTLAAVNLVPVKTLDGARALEAALYALLPYEKAQKCADTVSYFSFLFLTLGGLWLLNVTGCNFSLIIFCVCVFIGVYAKKESSDYCVNA